jgi:hypothetical protein
MGRRKSGARERAPRETLADDMCDDGERWRRDRERAAEGAIHDGGVNLEASDEEDVVGVMDLDDDGAGGDGGESGEDEHDSDDDLARGGKLGKSAPLAPRSSLGR